MGAFVAVPASGHGPGVLVLMEIFGVGSYIRRAAERLAELGYVALAPDLYRRTEPGLELGHAEGGHAARLRGRGRLDLDGAVQDAIVALDHLRALARGAGPGRGPRVLPRRIARLRGRGSGQPRRRRLLLRLGDPRRARRGRADHLSGAVSLRRPGPVHPARAGRASGGRLGERPGWETHIQPDGGHAFDNHDSEIFYRPEAAARAWQVTADFLQRELSGSRPVAATTKPGP